MNFLVKVYYWLRGLWFARHPRVRGKYGRARAAQPEERPAPVKAMPPAPATWRAPRGVTWGMLGNAVYGDCVFAGVAHGCMAVGKRLGLMPRFTEPEVVKWYLNWDHGVDSGAIIPAVLNAAAMDAWTVKPFYGYGEFGPAGILNYTNVDQIKSAIAAFGCVVVGAEIQQAQETQFDNGQMWDYVPGSPVVGGHCVVLIGYNATGPMVVSWGKMFRATWAWVTNVCDEAYVSILPPVVSAGKYVDPIITLEQYVGQMPRAE